jgi:glutamine synthetase
VGMPLRSMEHESGPGQVETTFAPLSALDAADAMLLFRTVTKQVCARRGFHASFMSLPRLDGFDPSGWHLHQSVVHTLTGHNAFAADSGADRLSPEGHAYVSGLLARARDFCLLSIPTVNGYRRLGAEFPLSPTRVDWSFEDRTAMVRAQGENASARFENRMGEPCANPYLSIAAQLFAGLDGIRAARRANEDREVSQSSPLAPGPTRLPLSLEEALADFRAGPASDLLGEPLANCLARIKASELARYRAWTAERSPAEDGTEGITEWEQREYFATF